MLDVLGVEGAGVNSNLIECAGKGAALIDGELGEGAQAKEEVLDIAQRASRLVGGGGVDDSVDVDLEELVLRSLEHDVVPLPIVECVGIGDAGQGIAGARIAFVTAEPLAVGIGGMGVVDEAEGVAVGDVRKGGPLGDDVVDTANGVFLKLRDIDPEGKGKGLGIAKINIGGVQNLDVVGQPVEPKSTAVDPIAVRDRLGPGDIGCVVAIAGDVEGVAGEGIVSDQTGVDLGKAAGGTKA